MASAWIAGDRTGTSRFPRDGVSVSDAHGFAEARRIFHPVFSDGAGISGTSGSGEARMVPRLFLLRRVADRNHPALHIRGENLLVPRADRWRRPVRPLCEPKPFCGLRGAGAAGGIVAAGVPWAAAGRFSDGRAADHRSAGRADSFRFARRDREPGIRNRCGHPAGTQPARTGRPAHCCDRDCGARRGGADRVDGSRKSAREISHDTRGRRFPG